MPATIKAVAYLKNTISGDINTVKIPVSFGKPISIYPQPAVKFAARYGSTLNDGVKASDKYTDGNWLGYEGENLSAVITLENKFKISKVTFGYLQNSDESIFAPHSVIVETSVDGITYKSAGVYDFDDNKWNVPITRSEVSVSFPETEAAFLRLLIFNRGKCPDNHPAAGKKAWIFVDEITVE
jgi:hexosaminidase